MSKRSAAEAGLGGSGSSDERDVATDTAAAVAAPAESSGAAPALPRRVQLYTDVLHVMMAFCSLRDLGRASGVSRLWHAAELALPLRGREDQDHVVVLQLRSASPLVCRRATDCLIDGALAVPALQLLRRMTRLTSLNCRFSLASRMLTPDLRPAIGAGALPATLTRLRLRVSGLAVRRSGRIAVLLTAVAALPALASLTVYITRVLPGFPLHPHPVRSEAFGGVLEPLTGMRALTSLSINGVAELERDVRMLRSLGALTHLDFGPFGASGAVLSGLLRAPVKLPHLRHLVCGGKVQWTEMLDDAAHALDQYPALESLLYVSYVGVDPSFLRRLPALTALGIGIQPSTRLSAARTPPAALASALSACTGLTRLDVRHDEVTSAQLATVLARMPQLTDLTLSKMHGLGALACLLHAPRLRVLCILYDVGLVGPAAMRAAVSCVVTLRELTALTIHRAITYEWRDEARLTPYDGDMPALRTFLNGLHHAPRLP